MSKALSKARVNIIAVVLMLIAFVGQVFAYADVSCQMSHDLTHSPAALEHTNMDHSGMDHGNMTHADMTHSQMSTMDVNCCGADCVCAASACTTVAFIPAAIIATHIPYLTEAANFQQINQLHSVTSTLYRPPIIH